MGMKMAKKKPTQKFIEKYALAATDRQTTALSV
jgi:hypothetical protein